MFYGISPFHFLLFLFVHLLLRVFKAEVLTFSFHRDASLHPLRFWRAFKEMVEELLQTDCQILCVATLNKVVIFAVILQQPCRFA